MSPLQNNGSVSPKPGPPNDVLCSSCLLSPAGFFPESQYPGFEAFRAEGAVAGRRDLSAESEAALGPGRVEQSEPFPLFY